MEIVVQKYGGSSVADVPKLERVADRIARTAREGKRVCVVVSAMGRTTDQLLALAREITDSPPRRELDMLLSTGERIAMALLAMAIQKRGLEAISFTGSQSGIMTNDRHSGARIIEVRPVRIQDELERDKIVIVAGFQGMSYKREITTLGRGGSDTTAVALAAALGASYCEICSDVDGVYTADPRVVAEALRLDTISYPEMQELAEHGAKVLNAQAVEWAEKAGIQIYARATHSEAGGTRVGNQASGRRACGVACARNLVRLRARGPASSLGRSLADEGVSLWRLSDDGSGTVAVFSKEDLPDWLALKRRLLDRFGEGLAVEEDLAAISVVGTGLAPASEVSRALDEVARTETGALGIDTSPLRLTLLVRPSDSEKLTRALHQAFVNPI
ncbi:MAG: aspartate kinase [Acidobacteria bacterium]|nr:MAG: aspartate kinase [Acidobacteriota bacterium]